VIPGSKNLVDFIRQTHNKGNVKPFELVCVWGDDNSMIAIPDIIAIVPEQLNKQKNMASDWKEQLKKWWYSETRTYEQAVYFITQVEQEAEARGYERACVDAIAGKPISCDATSSGGNHEKGE
jgi:hypothetical protein